MPHQVREPSRADRYRGALLGLAVGDAVGTTLEFRPPGSFEPITDMLGGGPFDLPAGAWTDDTSMALCLADSLLDRGDFDPIDQLERYVRWYRDGYRSSTGRCFDIGNSTRRALTAFERDRDPYPGKADPEGAGNGPLMKLAPVPMAYARHPEAALERARLSALTTHGAPQALDAARYMAALMVGALDGLGRGHLLGPEIPFEPFARAWERNPLHPEVQTIAGGSHLGKDPPEIKGGGYVCAALEAALWAIDHNDDFESTILAAANLGDDADTAAAIAGQLAGAIYGAEGIPAHWRRRVHLGGEITGIADQLAALAERIDPAGEVWEEP